MRWRRSGWCGWACLPAGPGDARDGNGDAVRIVLRLRTHRSADACFHGMRPARPHCPSSREGHRQACVASGFPVQPGVDGIIDRSLCGRSVVPTGNRSDFTPRKRVLQDIRDWLSRPFGRRLPNLMETTTVSDLAGVFEVLLLVAANGFFVASEFSLVAVRRSRVAGRAAGPYRPRRRAGPCRQPPARIAAASVKITGSASHAGGPLTSSAVK